jgi:hypothetical protein
MKMLLSTAFMQLLAAQPFSPRIDDRLLPEPLDCVPGALPLGSLGIFL